MHLNVLRRGGKGGHKSDKELNNFLELYCIDVMSINLISSGRLNKRLNIHIKICIFTTRGKILSSHIFNKTTQHTDLLKGRKDPISVGWKRKSATF